METIAIVGMRCCGKTTVGRALAARLGVRFTDTDEMVEQELGASIASLFAHGREAEFRVVEETVCIQSLKSGGVVALGGGSITSEAVRRALWSVLTVFLDAGDTLIATRLQSCERPSLTGLAPWVEAVEINRERRPWYLDVSDFVVHVDDRSVDSIVDEIVRSVRGLGGDER